MIARALRLQFALGVQVCQHGLDAKLVDRAQGGIGDAQADPALLVFEPETAVLQVRQETTLGLVVRVRDAIANHRALLRDDTYARHVLSFGRATPYRAKPTILS